jgi:hypothetical protein
MMLRTITTDCNTEPSVSWGGERPESCPPWTTERGRLLSFSADDCPPQGFRSTAAAENDNQSEAAACRTSRSCAETKL